MEKKKVSQLKRERERERSSCFTSSSILTRYTFFLLLLLPDDDARWVVESCEVGEWGEVLFPVFRERRDECDRSRDDAAYDERVALLPSYDSWVDLQVRRVGYGRRQGLRWLPTWVRLGRPNLCPFLRSFRFVVEHSERRAEAYTQACSCKRNQRSTSTLRSRHHATPSLSLSLSHDEVEF